MTNKEREIMVNLIRRSKQALVITIDAEGCAGFFNYNSDFGQAIISILKMHSELLDDMKYCISVIEKERILN